MRFVLFTNLDVMLPCEVQVSHFKVRSLATLAMQSPNDGAIRLRYFVYCVGVSSRNQVVTIYELIDRIGVSVKVLAVISHSANIVQMHAVLTYK